MCVWGEISGSEDTNVFGVENTRGKEGGEFVWVFYEEGDGERVDDKRHLVGGEVKRQLGGVTHGPGLFGLRGVGVEVGSKCLSRGGRVGDEQGDGATVVDLGRDHEGESTVCISKDTGGRCRAW